MPVQLLECDQQISALITNTEITLSATVYEVGGEDPTGIIRTDQDWYVDVEWQITGNLVRHLCGNWHVAVALESIGPGGEYQFPDPSAIVAMEPCGDGHYTYRIDVPAGAVDARDPDGTVYIVAVTLGSTDPCGAAGHIHANCRDGELQFVPGPAHGGP